MKKIKINELNNYNKEEKEKLRLLINNLIYTEDLYDNL